MRKYKGFLLLALCLYHGASFALDHAQAWSACETMRSQQGTPSNFQCQQYDQGIQHAVRLIRTSNNFQLGIWGYTIECNTNGYIYDPVTHLCGVSCPANQNYDTNTSQCVDKPPCTTAQRLIHSTTCAYTPYYPQNLGQPKDCKESYSYSGITTVINNIICTANNNLGKWADDMIDTDVPPPGVSKKCANGDTITYPESCSTHVALNGATWAGTTQRTLAQQLSRLGNQFVHATRSEQSSSDSNYPTTQTEYYQTIPKAAVGQGLLDALGSDVVPTAVTNAVNQLSTLSGGEYQVINGLVYPATGEGTVPLSGNQLIDQLDRFQIDIPLTSLLPYVNPSFNPGWDDAIVLSTQDYHRLYDNDSGTTPYYFPSTIFQSGNSPFTVFLQPPFSQLPYFRPATVTPPAQTPTQNTQQKPEVRTTQKWWYAPDGQKYAIDPETGEIIGYNNEPPPTAPEIPDDKPPFFPFIEEFQNPFGSEIINWMPMLPESTCSYEVHTTIFGRPFDLAPCVPLTPLRTILAWACSVSTAWIVFRIVFRGQV
jgi:hypothetical protein